MCGRTESIAQMTLFVTITATLTVAYSLIAIALMLLISHEGNH